LGKKEPPQQEGRSAGGIKTQRRGNRLLQSVKKKKKLEVGNESAEKQAVGTVSATSPPMVKKGVPEHS